ncbi:hypothetical protein ACQP2F_14645 [Actinoplanes sp. CA-030573]|uniref:hypothetical protein n=1 Tax=Actinoplanes sp. CA-030573 TaxID=3239898 RepID=UPI003D8E35C1
MKLAGRFDIFEYPPVTLLRNVACRGRPQGPILRLVGLVHSLPCCRGCQLGVGSDYVHLVGDEYRLTVLRLPVGDFALAAGSDPQQRYSRQQGGLNCADDDHGNYRHPCTFPPSRDSSRSARPALLTFEWRMAEHVQWTGKKHPGSRCRTAVVFTL